jgi:hypothetical protein
MAYLGEVPMHCFTCIMAVPETPPLTFRAEFSCGKAGGNDETRFDRRQYMRGRAIRTHWENARPTLIFSNSLIVEALDFNIYQPLA